MRDKRVVLRFIFTVYFCVDMMVGYAYWLTIQKVNQIIGVYTHHYSAPMPLVNIILYRPQIDLFKTIPEFSMALFYQALMESVFSLLLFFAITFVMFGVLARRDTGEG